METDMNHEELKPHLAELIKNLRMLVAGAEKLASLPADTDAAELDNFYSTFDSVLAQAINNCRLFRTARTGIEWELPKSILKDAPNN
jgi:hypothetical protein